MLTWNRIERKRDWQKTVVPQGLIFINNSLQILSRIFKELRTTNVAEFGEIIGLHVLWRLTKIWANGKIFELKQNLGNSEKDFNYRKFSLSWFCQHEKYLMKWFVSYWWYELNLKQLNWNITNNGIYWSWNNVALCYVLENFVL